MKIWLDGRIVDKEDAVISVYDHGLLYGDGIFEGLRFYNGRIFRCDQHLKRLEQGTRAIRLQLPYSLEEIQRAMCETIEASGLRDGYIRLVVTRGSGSLGLSIKKTSNPIVFAIVDKISLYPPELYERGMPVIISSVSRMHPNTVSPRLKSLNYLNNIMAKIEAQDAGCDEAIMLSTDGYVAEATGDNVFMVRDGVVQTPPTHVGILEGITRSVVMEICQRNHIPLVEKMLVRSDLYIADEVFLTGTAAEVIAVSEIDKRPIGPTGTRSSVGIGPITRQIMAGFKEVVARECVGAETVAV